MSRETLEARAAHVHRLRTKGFHPLRSGRIHMRCPECGRKQSNMPRTEMDAPRAFLVEIHCDDCGLGCKDLAPEYFTARGHRIEWDGPNA